MSATAAWSLVGTLGPRGAYRRSEVLVAIFVALSVPVWSSVLIAIAALDEQANAPLISPGNDVPIRVRPVIDLDSPLLKLGGKKVRAKLPDRWKKPVAPKKIAQRKAHVSTKAGEEVADIPPEDLEVSDGGEAPDPDAAVAKQVDVELTEDSDAGTEASGGGSPGGVPEGTETNPLKARAANLYHSRILSFLKRGFHCPAVDEETKKSCRPTASVSISPNGTVSSFSFNPCGHGAIDGAARGAIASKVGQSIPPPPENYPDLRPNSFSVAYVCR